jgi:hypothetical protein
VSSEPESTVVAYLRAVGRAELEARQLARLAAAQARAGSRRRRLPMTGRALVVAAALTIGLATGLAIATGLAPWGGSSPARLDKAGQAPAAARAMLGVLRQPRENTIESEQSAAVAQLRSPWVVSRDSIRPAGENSLGDPIYVMYAKMAPAKVPSDVHVRPEDQSLEGVYVSVVGSHNGVGSDGPYALKDIERGTAFGINEVSAVQLTGSPSRGTGPAEYFTAVLPDGVAEMKLTFRDNRTQTITVAHNVATAQLHSGEDAAAVQTIQWRAPDGRSLRDVHLR